MKGYRTIQRPGQGEHVEKRSRFIGAAQPVHTEAEALAFIAHRKKQHYDARHNCFAYILREGGAQRYGDDGEPQGTAGVPMLEVLRKNQVVDVAVVVTRYFGGVLLGAGGLVRAYSHAAALALEAAVVVAMEPWDLFTLEVDYGFYGKLQNLLERHGAVVVDADFGGLVRVEARILSVAMGAFTKELTELSSGGITPKVGGQVYAEV